jgi:two-component system cell cycle sensor histidine kinase/response regulator CckA
LLAFRLGSDISLTLDLTEDNDGARAEPSQLDRALLNLVANARYAIEGAGTVTLRAERRLLVAASSCVPDTIPAGDYIVIVVADTGSGIARDQLRHVFDPGFSSRIRSGGSGLGLSSVRDIVRELTGFLAIESIRGCGTSVAIFLPRHAREWKSARAAKAHLTTRAGVVLLVDDDVLVRQLTEQILRRAGWTVLCAGSAEVALEVSQHSAYDLLITDVAMQGMDGVTLTRQTLSRRPDLPVILTSGYAELAAMDEWRSANVSFLTKPYGRADLLGAISRVTQRRAAEASRTR